MRSETYKKTAAGRNVPPRTLHNRVLRIIAEVHRPRRHQHPHSRAHRDHVAAFTARSTSRKKTRSTPGSARTTTPAISIAIDPVPFDFAAAAADGGAATTGTNRGVASSGNTKRPCRAALRHANRCCDVISCRRATSEATAPGAKDSATMRPFSATLHRRRRPTSSRISTRPRRGGESTICSTIYVNRSCDPAHILDLPAALEKGGERRPLTVSR